MPAINESLASVWKWIATLLAGAVIGGIPLFITTASNVDASQVREIVNRESPYFQDKSLIFYKLDQLRDLLTNQQRYVHQQSLVWHDVLCLAESQTVANRDMPQAQREQALLFYDRSLILAHAEPCKGLKR